MGKSVVYGTLLNSCSYNKVPRAKIFCLTLQLGGTYAIMEWESHDSTLLHKLTGSHFAYGTLMTTSFLSWIKFYMISTKVRIFFKLLLFSALLLMANQVGNQTSKVSSMLQKTAHVAYGTKTSQNQNHVHITW